MAERPAPLPDLDWSPQRAEALGIRMVEVWRDFLASLPNRPVSPGLSADRVRDAVTMPVPDDPLPDPVLLDHVRSVVDHSMYPGHPAFMAYITGAGTVPGAAADFIAAALNQNLGAGGSARARPRSRFTCSTGSPSASGCPRTRPAG